MNAEPLRTMRADLVEMKSIRWLDKPLLQDSAFQLLAGPKGVGKGTWLMTVAACMSRGMYGTARDVLIVSSEDSAAVDVVPRLRAAGADLERVQIVIDHIVLPNDLERLRQLAVATGDVGLLIIDPLGNHLGGADTDKEGAVRYAIAGLNKLADELACCVIGVRHISKNRANGAVAAVLGSTAWVDLPRAVLMVARDDEDDDVFHVQVVAGNRAGRSAAESFRIEPTTVEGLAEPVTRAVALGQSAKHVDDLLTAATSTRGQKRDSARDLILAELADGPKQLDYLKARCASELGVSGETAYRAASGLKADGKVRARNSGPGSPWLWHLTDANPDSVTPIREAA